MRRHRLPQHKAPAGMLTRNFHPHSEIMCFSKSYYLSTADLGYLYRLLALYEMFPSHQLQAFSFFVRSFPPHSPVSKPMRCTGYSFTEGVYFEAREFRVFAVLPSKRHASHSPFRLIGLTIADESVLARNWYPNRRLGSKRTLDRIELRIHKVRQAFGIRFSKSCCLL